MAHIRCLFILCFVYPALGEILSNEVTNNDRPIVGILSQEVSPSTAAKYGNYSSYIAASYVKYLEGAGARVVPIMIGKSKLYYSKLVKSLNAILFPGGGTYFDEPDGYADAGEIIFKLAKKSNEQGEYFPLWGTCLGFELMTYLAADRKEHRTLCSSENRMLPLDFKPDFLNSRLFSDAPKSIINILLTKNVTPNFHHWCVTEKNMTKFGLIEDWHVLTTNRDDEGLEFVSAIESRTYPFYATIFHPEKLGFEWKETQATPHDLEAVRVMQYFADFFVNEARKSQHKFRTLIEERKALIYNKLPTYTANNTIYQQMYFFK